MYILRDVRQILLDRIRLVKSGAVTAFLSANCEHKEWQIYDTTLQTFLFKNKHKKAKLFHKFIYGESSWTHSSGKYEFININISILIW